MAYSTALKMEVWSGYLETLTKTTLCHLTASASSETSENIYQTTCRSEVSDFRREEHDNCALLDYYAGRSATARRVTAQKNAVHIYAILQNIHGVSWFIDITAGDDFLGLYDQEISYIHVSNFGPFQSYGWLNLKTED